MTNDSSYNEITTRLFPTLKQYVPVVERVHGGSHPEFHQVRAIFNQIVDKTEAAGSAKPELTDEFRQLRQITADYTVPGDVCESYEAVYNMLSEVDQAYFA